MVVRDEMKDDNLVDKSKLKNHISLSDKLYVENYSIDKTNEDGLDKVSLLWETYSIEFKKKKKTDKSNEGGLDKKVSYERQLALDKI